MKTIEEKNRMIAEFIGYDIGIEQICIDDLSDKQEAFCFDNIMTPQQRSSYMRGTKYFDIKNVFALQYHTSWEWLMPVVEKIEKLGYDFEIHREWATITDMTDAGNFKMIQLNELDKKDSTYCCVVEFIEWYNENK